MEKKDKERLAELLDRLTKIVEDTKDFELDLKHFKTWYADTSDLNAKDYEYLVQMLADIKGSQNGLVRAWKQGTLLFLDVI